MGLIVKVKNVLRGRMQAWGTARMKRELWNKEYAGGRWDLAKATPSDPVYRYIAKYGGGGTILELGCGSGNTGNDLDPATYVSYTGVDISDVAIEAAVRRSEASGRSTKNRYVTSDIVTYVPEQKYNLIVLRESIYYIPLWRLGEVLDRYQGCLGEHGAFIVTIVERHAYKKFVDAVENRYKVLDKYIPDAGEGVLLVFQ